MKDIVDVVARPIATDFYNHKGERIARHRSVDPLRAAGKCTMYMAADKYAAASAEVHDLETGRLHYVMKMLKNGDLRVIFESTPRDFVTKSTARFFGIELE